MNINGFIILIVIIILGINYIPKLFKRLKNTMRIKLPEAVDIIEFDDKIIFRGTKEGITYLSEELKKIKNYKVGKCIKIGKFTFMVSDSIGNDTENLNWELPAEGWAMVGCMFYDVANDYSQFNPMDFNSWGYYAAKLSVDIGVEVTDIPLKDVVWYEESYVQVSYREATIYDIPQLMVVRFAVKENPLNTPGLVTEADYVEYLTNRGKGWVCEVNNAIVGFATVDLVDENVWALFVDPNYDARGIGKQLHKLMLDWYFNQGKTFIWLGTAPNTRAELFYTKQGWKNCGLRPNGEVRFEMTATDWQGKD